MDALLGRIAKLLALQDEALEWAQSPLLLLIRLAWGWQFFVDGRGKLGKIDDIAAWFGGDLGIPMPRLNAYAVSYTEYIGGALLFLGLGGRLVTIPLVITMLGAYLTSDRDTWAAPVEDVYARFDAVTEAAPFLFLLASVIILVFGPGAFSVDELVKRWWKARKAPKAASAGS